MSGFYKVRSHDIIPIDDCMLQQEISNTAVTIIRNFAEYKNIPIYNEKTHQGNLRRIIVKVGFETKQVMIVLVTKERILLTKRIDRTITKTNSKPYNRRVKYTTESI